MANTSISDLRSAGVDFFSDSESFLDDLNDNELSTVACRATSCKRSWSCPDRGTSGLENLPTKASGFSRQK